ncbi:hypothetical protein CPC08DRAFT_667057 [Agrocybe pediades]|nr:hypothetical protein CPC08DRAFT_667057 [Agrocybe pediades]
MAPVSDSQILKFSDTVYLRKGRPTSNGANDNIPTTVAGEDYLAPILTGSKPQIILIFAWMGARLPHLLKYSNVHSQIFPEATQIMVMSEPTFFFSSKSTRAAKLTPVVEVLEAMGALPPVVSKSKRLQTAGVDFIFPPSSPSVLVHVFSNGGSAQIMTLGDLLASRAIPPKAPTAIIFDSCPGDGGIQGTIRAFSSAVRNPVLRGFISLFIRALYLQAWIMHSIRRVFTSKPHQSILDKIKSRLNTERLLPWLSKDTPRLYVYSTKDVMIPDSEVEHHAADAKAKGFDVRLERYEDTSHVAHAKVHPERYWTSIRKLWEEASVLDDYFGSASKS